MRIGEVPWLGRKRGQSSRIKWCVRTWEDGEPHTDKYVMETARPVTEKDGYAWAELRYPGNVVKPNGLRSEARVHRPTRAQRKARVRALKALRRDHTLQG